MKCVPLSIVGTIYCLFCIGFCNWDSIQFWKPNQMEWLEPSFLEDFIPLRSVKAPDCTLMVIEYSLWPSSCSSFISENNVAAPSHERHEEKRWHSPSSSYGLQFVLHTFKKIIRKKTDLLSKFLLIQTIFFSLKCLQIF